MTNTEMLNKKIDESGLKKGYLADKLNLSRFGLSKKINNESEFRTSEIVALCRELKLTTKERDQIFFCSK